MDYTKKALETQNEIISAIYEENFEKINSLIEIKRELYIRFSENYPDELKKLLNSKEYIDSEHEINRLFSIKKSEVSSELNKLNKIKKATKEYQNNTIGRNAFLNKKI